MKSKRVAAGAENSDREVAQSEETRPQPLNSPSLDEIQRQASEIHIDRGAPHRHDQDDWLQAERELMEKYKAS
jgi:Protein of unknown function (DUF2934)